MQNQSLLELKNLS